MLQTGQTSKSRKKSPESVMKPAPAPSVKLIPPTTPSPPVTFDNNRSGKKLFQQTACSNGRTKNALVLIGIIYATTVILRFDSPFLVYPMSWVELNDCLQTILMYLMGCTNISWGCANISRGYANISRGCANVSRITGRMAQLRRGQIMGNIKKYYNSYEIAEYVY